MATYTNNLNLKKPNPEDFYNISDFNGNVDIIDEEVNKRAHKVTGGTSGNFVKLDTNGDMVDSGKSADDLTNIINTINSLIENFQNVGGFKKYANAGTYTFVVPIGITEISVSAIGGGGGGGGGGGSNTSSYGGGGGGGGGYGNYTINQSISVTPEEELTVIIGSGGAGGESGENDTYYHTNGKDGSTGGTTYLKRGSTILVSATGGTGGKGGQKVVPYSSGTKGYGGSGGTTDGKEGGTSTNENVGKGGTGGENSIFRLCGKGGTGGNGGIKITNGEPTNGDVGSDGGLGIAFGTDVDSSSIPW